MVRSAHRLLSAGGPVGSPVTASIGTAEVNLCSISILTVSDAQGTLGSGDVRPIIAECSLPCRVGLAEHDQAMHESRHQIDVILGQ